MALKIRIKYNYLYLACTHARTSTHTHAHTNWKIDIKITRKYAVTVANVATPRLCIPSHSLSLLTPHSHMCDACSLICLQMDELVSQMQIPDNIAMTQALKENIFSVIVCAACKIPLIMVGEPGSSKTLSVTLVATNMRGEESEVWVDSCLGQGHGKKRLEIYTCVTCSLVRRCLPTETMLITCWSWLTQRDEITVSFHCLKFHSFRLGQIVGFLLSKVNM